MKIRYFPKRGFIWLDFKDAAGERHRVPTTATTQAHAELLAPAIIALRLNGKPTSENVPTTHGKGPTGAPMGPCGVTLRAAYDKGWKEREKWLEAKDRAGKDQTFKCIISESNGMLTEDTDCAKLTRAFVLNLRAHWMTLPGKRKDSKLSNSTINHRLSMLTTLLELADCAPHTVKHLSVVNNTRKRRVRPDELKAVAQWCVLNHHRKDATTLADLILVGIDTTARMGELLALEWKDVYFERSVVVYRDTKNGHAREGVLFDTAKRIFERRIGYGNKGPFIGTGQSQLGALWRDARKALGLADDHEFVFHVATRHEGLSQLAEAGESVLMLQAMGGHRSVAALKRYVKPSTDSMLEMQTRLKRNAALAGERPQGGTDA